MVVAAEKAGKRLILINPKLTDIQSGGWVGRQAGHAWGDSHQLTFTLQLLVGQPPAHACCPPHAHSLAHACPRPGSLAPQRAA